MYKFSQRVRTLFPVLILWMVSLSLVACDEGGDSSTSYIEIKNLTVSSSGGNGEIAIYAELGTNWSAEITSGVEYASFDISTSVLTSEGTVMSPYTNRLYIYFGANSTDENLKATVSFTFEGEDAETITFVQFSAEYEDLDPVYGWAEIPTTVENSNYQYVTHYVEYNSKTIRNFSMCYDIKNYGARWVAYPFHKIYDDGGDVGRVENWAYDPKIETQYQPNLSKSYSGSYDRGHQCASADRQSTEEMNIQTFYYSNMTPQLGTLNQQKWSSVESIVRNQVCSDTLYVVTGADYSSSIGSTTDASGKNCPIPSAYYKVMMRTRTGVTGKSVEECSSDELKAIGYWFEHQYYSTIPEPVSVATIEERTGFTFFPTIPDEVKQTFNTSLWSL